MGYYLDPFCDEYQLRWQTAFSKRRKVLGPHGARHAQSFVSTVRAMRRVLIAGGKPSLFDYPSFGHAHPERIIQKRTHQRLRRAIDRGETDRSLARRGFFGALKEYSTRHSR